MSAKTKLFGSSTVVTDISSLSSSLNMAFGTSTGASCTNITWGNFLNSLVNYITALTSYYQIKLSSSDTAPGYLGSKLIWGDEFTVSDQTTYYNIYLSNKFYNTDRTYYAKLGGSELTANRTFEFPETGYDSNLMAVSHIYEDSMWKPYNIGLVATINCTAAQLLSSYSSPIELLPAYGSGIFTEILSLSYSYTYNGTVFAGSYPYFVIYYGATTKFAGEYYQTGTLSTTSFLAKPTRNSGTVYANSAIKLTTYGSSDLTAGNGTLAIMIAYSVYGTT